MATLSEIQTILANKLGEETYPATSDTDYILRKTFINRIVERLVNMRDWRHLATTATVTVTGGNATITGMKKDGLKDVRVVNSGDTADYIFEEVPYQKHDDYTSSDYVYYLTGNVLTTKYDTSALTVRYQPAYTALSTLSSSIDFPAGLIASGALVDTLYSSDPDEPGPIQLAQQTYSDELREYLAQENIGDVRIFESIGNPIGE